MDPQQELFISLRNGLIELGYDVYDTILPPEGTPYPLIYLGGVEQSDEANKSAVFGTVSQTIDVWHNQPSKRGTLSALMLNVKTLCRSITNTEHYRWQVSSLSQRILADTTTSESLLHGIITVEFRFS